MSLHRNCRYVLHRLALLVGVLMAGSAMADDWSFKVTPYFWGSGQTGTVGLLPGVPPSEVDLSFSEILDDLEGSVMILGSARRDGIGFSVDFQSVRTRSEGDTPGSLFGGTTVKSDSKIATATFDYRLTRSDRSELWGSAGVRYWNVENTLTFQPGTRPGRSVSGRDEWWDPVVGLTGHHELSEKGSLVGWAFLGGFGAGSDLMTDVFAGYNHSFTPTTSMTVGWRHLSVDRSDGDFIYDVDQSGPIVGVSFNF